MSFQFYFVLCWNEGIAMAIRVQILEEAVCISRGSYTLPPVMGKL